MTPSAILRVALAGALLAVAVPAQGQARSGLLVLRLEHADLDAALAASLESAAREAAERHVARKKGKLLPRPRLDLESMQLTAGCSDDSPACIASIARTLGASDVLRLSIAGTARRATLRLALHQGQRVQRAEAELGALEPGSEVEVAWHVARLLGDRPEPLTGAIVLRPPAGVTLDVAELRLDDRPVTAAALGAVTPGRHRVDVRHPGHEGFIWLGEVRPARTVEVAVVLDARVADTPAIDAAPAGPAPGVVAESPETSARSGRLVTWVLAGGTALAAGGGAALGLSVLRLEDEATSERLDCAGLDREADVCRSGRSFALLTNVAWAATGLLAASAVAAFFLEGPAEPALSVAIVPTARGAEAGLLVRF